MNRKFGCVIAMPLFALLALGCGSSSFNCPTLGDNITWDSYGHFSLQNSGDDSTARNCVSDCGWSVFQGHNGGTGDTLQVSSPNGEVVFAWAYNNFAAFRVTSGWTGETDQGVKLGDSMSTFLTHYQGFATIASNHLRFSSGSTTVDAYFDKNNLLTELIVDGYIAP